MWKVWEPSAEHFFDGSCPVKPEARHAVSLFRRDTETSLQKLAEHRAPLRNVSTNRGLPVAHHTGDTGLDRSGVAADSRRSLSERRQLADQSRLARLAFADRLDDRGQVAATARGDG
jgi:hypothetical protein